jgi:hypothetical protein
MSDSPDQPPSRERDPSRENEADGFSEPPPETSGGGSTDRFNLPTLNHWGVRWREWAFTWLDETLSRKKGDADPFYLKSVLPVMDRLAGIGTGLIAMVMVDRQYGPVGLGIFAWFFSLLAIAGYLGRYGIPIDLENRIARSPESVNDNSADAHAALVALGIAAIILCAVAAFWIAGTGDGILFLLLGPTIFFRTSTPCDWPCSTGRGATA